MWSCPIILKTALTLRVTCQVLYSPWPLTPLHCKIFWLGVIDNSAERQGNTLQPYPHGVVTSHWLSKLSLLTDGRYLIYLLAVLSQGRKHSY